ncbi:hypothetical protein ACHAXT_008995 [Thalassiosira profunda]
MKSIYDSTYVGTVLRAFDGRKEGGKQAVWKVEASWVLPGHPEGQRYSVRRQDVHLQQPAPNPITTVANFPDSINHRDIPTRGSTTYRPSAANNPPSSAAASSASTAAAAAAAGTGTGAQKRAHDGGDSNDIAGSGRRRRRSGASGGQQKDAGTFDNEQDALDWLGPPPSPAGAKIGSAGMAFVAGENGQHRVVSINHGTKWTAASSQTVYGDVVKTPPSMPWYQMTPLGDKVGPGARDFESMSRLDAFLLMFPPAQLDLVQKLTEEKLRAKNPEDRLTKQELIKFFGICLLITRTNYSGDRHGLWDGGNVHSKYLPSYDFNKTGMGRNRFDAIWYALTWSRQPTEKPQDMSSKRYRWMLLDDHIRNYNEHRAKTFSPGGELVIDETIVRWYGLCGAYVNIGLPQYVEMERKPDNGMELQDVACVESKVMLQLKVVDAAEEEARREKDLDLPESYTGLKHGTKVTLELVEPWNRTGRLLVGDSYFGSVECARELKKLDFDAILNVKNSHTEFPLQYLDAQVMGRRGDRYALVSFDEETGRPQLIAWAWMDRNRRFFVSTCCGLAEGTEIFRERYRQTSEDPQADAERVAIEVRQPKAVETYYNGAGVIDGINKTHAAELRADRCLATKDWARRANFGVWGQSCVDSMNVYQPVVHPDLRDASSDIFFSHLADEMIDNNVGVRATRRRVSSEADDDGEAETGTETAAARPMILRQTIVKKKKEPKSSSKKGCEMCFLNHCRKEHGDLTA